jgi:hypothetical protein
VIRPANALSRVFSLAWYWKVLLTLVLVYPLFLVIEFFAGRRWYNLRVAFPLTRWRRLPGASAGEEDQQQQTDEDEARSAVDHAHSNLSYPDALALATQLLMPPLPSSAPRDAASSVRPAVKVAQFQVPGAGRRPVDGRGPWLYLVGQQEGEWLRGHESKIVEAVRRGVRGGVNLNDDAAVARAVTGWGGLGHEADWQRIMMGTARRDPVEMLRGYHEDVGTGASSGP